MVILSAIGIFLLGVALWVWLTSDAEVDQRRAQRDLDMRRSNRDW
jgi:hypothetical protein